MTNATRQPDSSMCFVCGRDNPIGLHLQFYVEGDKVCTSFTPREEHQGWPGILHGGIISTILDETVGRTCFLVDMWAVTAKFELQYLKPVPIGQELTVSGEIVNARSRTLEATGELRLADGTLAVTAKGLYVRIPDAKRRELEATLDLR
jgi:acyl-coenzyme A thioesterase PaaI-like protein